MGYCCWILPNGDRIQAEKNISPTPKDGLYCHLGLFDGTVTVHRRAMKGFERALGERHASTLKATLDLADMSKGLERHAEASHLFTRVLQVYEERVQEVRSGEGGK